MSVHQSTYFQLDLTGGKNIMADFSEVINGIQESFDIILDFVFELFPLVLILSIVVGVVGMIKFRAR